MINNWQLSNKKFSQVSGEQNEKKVKDFDEGETPVSSAKMNKVHISWRSMNLFDSISSNNSR